jgi:hypothetical protein
MRSFIAHIFALLVLAAMPAAAQEATVLEGNATVQMDRENPLVGDRVIYRLEVTLPAGHSLSEPDDVNLTPALKPLREEVVIRQLTDSDGNTFQLDIPSILIRTGRIKIAPRSFAFEASGAEAGTVEAGRIIFHTGSYFASENAPEPAEAFSPLPVIERNWLLIWSLIILGTVVLAVGITLIILRRLKPRAPKPEPPPPPAHILAYAALDALDRQDLLEKGELEKHYTELSLIIRAYLGNKWKFDSMDLTTEELNRYMEQISLPQAHFRELELLFSDLDLVKFANASPADSTAREVTARVRSFVQQTCDEPGESS